jgi:adenylate kinase family enzyme
MAVVLLGAPIEPKRRLEEDLVRAAELQALDHAKVMRGAAGTGADLPDGPELRRLVASGREIPDELQIRVLEHRLATVGNFSRLLLTNFPRTPRQGVLLDELLAKRAASVARVVWVELSETRLVKYLVETQGLDHDTAATKAASFTRTAVPLKIFYSERGILRRVSGQLPPEELLRDAQRALTS